MMTQTFWTVQMCLGYGTSEGQGSQKIVEQHTFDEESEARKFATEWFKARQEAKEIDVWSYNVFPNTRHTDPARMKRDVEKFMKTFKNKEG